MANVPPAREVPDDQNEEGEEQDGPNAHEDQQDEAEQWTGLFTATGLSLIRNYYLNSQLAIISCDELVRLNYFQIPYQSLYA